MNSSHDQNLDYMMLIFLFGPPVYNQRFHVTHIWFLRFQWNSSVYTSNNLHAEVTSGCGRKQHIYTLKGVRAVFRSNRTIAMNKISYKYTSSCFAKHHQWSIKLWDDERRGTEGRQPKMFVLRVWFLSNHQWFNGLWWSQYSWASWNGPIQHIWLLHLPWE